VSYRTSKASKKKVEELRSSFNQLVSRLSPSSSYMKVGYRHCVNVYYFFSFVAQLQGHFFQELWSNQVSDVI
jgi:hypothetical protein